MAMTFTETVNTLMTSTLAQTEKQLRNSVFQETPFLTFISAKNRMRAADGSREVRLPIIVDDTDNSTWFDEDGEVSTEGADPDRFSRWDWKYVATPVKQIFTQVHKNSSKWAILNMIQNSIEQARMSLSANFETVLNGDGTTLKAPEGLQSLVSATPTATKTIGGWDQGSYAWWQNQKVAAGGTSATTYLMNGLRDLHWECCKYGPEPDFHVCDGNLYKRYCRVVEERFLNTSREMADLGWPDILTYKQKPVIPVRKAQADTWRMCNSKDLFVFYDPSNWFKLGPWKNTPSNVNEVAHIVCACIFAAWRRVVQGVLTGVTAD